jgi:hypothetical protein
MSNLPFHKQPGNAALVGATYANGASALTAIKCNLASAVNPAVTDSSAAGYAVGSRWLNTTASREWICFNPAPGAAVWLETTNTAGGAASGTSLAETIVFANTFAAGNIIIRTASSWVKAQADNAVDSEVIGVLSAATGAGFTICYAGKMVLTAHGFTIGAALFLDPVTPGALTATEPSLAGQVSKPVAIAWDADTLFIVNMRGYVIPSVNSQGFLVGSIIDFAGTAAPAGYLICDGSAVSRSAFSSLFTAIGTTWGAGDGTTTFNIPNLTRRVSVGSGGARVATQGPLTTVGSLGGEETHQLIIGEIPSHTHTASALSTSGGGPFFTCGGGGIGGSPVTNAAGGGLTHNNMQLSAVVLKIIKT